MLLDRHVEQKFISEVVAGVYKRSRMKKEVITTGVDKETQAQPRARTHGDDDDGEDIDAKVSFQIPDQVVKHQRIWRSGNNTTVLPRVGFC